MNEFSMNGTYAWNILVFMVQMNIMDSNWNGRDEKLVLISYLK